MTWQKCGNFKGYTSMQMTPLTHPMTFANAPSLERNVWMHGGGLVKMPHTQHKPKRIQINAHSNKENKQGAGFYSHCHTPPKTYTKKVNHAVEFHCRVLTSEVINLSSNKRGETTENYAQAAVHYPSLPLSTHTHTEKCKNTS